MNGKIPGYSASVLLAQEVGEEKHPYTCMVRSQEVLKFPLGRNFFNPKSLLSGNLTFPPDRLSIEFCSLVLMAGLVSRNKTYFSIALNISKDHNIPADVRERIVLRFWGYILQNSFSQTFNLRQSFCLLV